MKQPVRHYKAMITNDLVICRIKRRKIETEQSIQKPRSWSHGECAHAITCLERSEDCAVIVGFCCTLDLFRNFVREILHDA